MMSIESAADLAGMQSVGRVVALTNRAILLLRCEPETAANNPFPSGQTADRGAVESKTERCTS